MTDLHMPTLRQARGADWDTIRALLSSSGLPVDDLGPSRLGGFLVAEDGGRLVGLIGLEILDTVGLLRSLVVEPSVRSAGLGGKLIGALEAAAQVAGLTELWLLTIDAERFFERHGFEIVSRETAPDSIRETDEFGNLCPETAYLMHKPIH